MRRFLFALSCLYMTTGVWANEPVSGKIPLAGLPSPAGPQIEKIKSLADNSWIALGAPAPDPKWGRARGRSWACKMPLANGLRGAFLYGEGVHGYTKPDGHYMDDLWFYDLNAHRWVCCYPGTDTKTADLNVNADGFETNKDGKIVAVAAMAHAYEMVTYDQDSKRFLSMPCDGGYWASALKQRKERLKDKPKTETRVSPWMYDTATGQWDRRITPGASPRSTFGDVLVYVPTRKKTFFWGRDGVWFYEAAGNTWSRPTVKGPKPPFGIDPTACYDAKRDRIYMGGGNYPVVPRGQNALWIYELATDSWIDPQPRGKPCQGSNGYSTPNAAMAYDSVNDMVVLFHHGGKKEERGVYIYNPETNAWADEPKSDFKAAGQCINAFYDPKMNAHFFHAAGDSRDDGVIWAYRYKQSR